MQIHRVGVGQHELDAPQRVPGSGVLTQQVREVGPLVPGPVHRRRVDLLPVAVQQLQPALLQLPPVALHGREDVLVEDGRGDGPGGVEDQVGQVGLEGRGLAVGRAHLYPGLPHGLPVAHELRLEAGDVDHQVVALHLVQDPAGAFHVGPDLLHPRGHRHVEGLQRRAAHRTVCRKPIAHLQVPHGALQRFVEHAGLGWHALRAIPGRCEPLAQAQHSVAAHPLLEGRAQGNRRPAAARGDGAKTGEGVAQLAIEGVLRPGSSE